MQNLFSRYYYRQKDRLNPGGEWVSAGLWPPRNTASAVCRPCPIMFFCLPFPNSPALPLLCFKPALLCLNYAQFWRSKFQIDGTAILMQSGNELHSKKVWSLFLFSVLGVKLIWYELHYCVHVTCTHQPLAKYVWFCMYLLYGFIRKIQKCSNYIFINWYSNRWGTKSVAILACQEAVWTELHTSPSVQ